ncbi:MAG: hypothetical protein A2178_04185 [Planctomycetes bacterium GWC2_49_10]|nr:MAG: hypothetical protein A2178_04185 [Planctomycetes bacterium GWC2_49_10]
MTKAQQLSMIEMPKMRNARMVLGFSGWMDGGEVSTGSVEYLITKLGAWKFAEIDPYDFYISSVPGSMENVARYRPVTTIADGFVREFQFPENAFFADEENNIIFFVGKEPNLKWDAYAQCIFSLAADLDVTTIYTIGSFAGLVPHTRQPRITATVSDPKTKAMLGHYGVKFTTYHGPSHIATYLIWLAKKRGISMASLVAEIPAYVEGKNPKCMDTTAKLLCALLEIHVDLDDLLDLSDEVERKLNNMVGQRPELLELIQKLELDYDNEVFDTEMGDLKVWLEQRGLRLD